MPSRKKISFVSSIVWLGDFHRRKRRAICVFADVFFVFTVKVVAPMLSIRRDIV